MSGITLLVARVTLRELSRRRGALALTLILPLAFFLVRLETHWTALRLLSMGLGWAVATLALFTQVSSRQIDRRLVVAGASPTSIHAGRHLAVLALGWAVAVPYSAMVHLTIGGQLERPTLVPIMLLLTTTVAVPLGSLAAALVPRDLEGALLLLAIMAVQVLVDPAESWTRVLPLWSTRELATVIVDPLGSATGAEHLHEGMAHGATFAVVLLALGTGLGSLRLRTLQVRPPLAPPAPPG